MVTVQSGECVGRRLVYNGFRGHKQPGDITHPEMSLSFSLHKMVLVTWHQYFEEQKLTTIGLQTIIIIINMIIII